MGTLYVVATPIGNLEDLSPRARRVLGEVALIAAEDTRHTSRMLAHFGVETPLISYHAFNEQARERVLLEALQTGDVALVSDAGTPAISDPGAALVDAALRGGHRVESVPGPSSLTAAVAASGLLTGPFTFLGFLPRARKERLQLLARAAGSGFGLVLYEAPGRLAGTVDELGVVAGGRRFAIVREVSKLHETIARGRLGDDTRELAAAQSRGEIVIVVEAGAMADEGEPPAVVLERLLAAGLRPSDAAREAAALTGASRSDLYALAIEIKAGRTAG